MSVERPLMAGDVNYDDDVAHADEAMMDEYRKGFMVAVKLSRGYLYLCVCNALLAFGLLGYMVYWTAKHDYLGAPQQPWFIGCEALLTSFLAAETIFTVVAEGRHFWENWWNIFDVFVAVMSLASFFIVVMTNLGTLEDIDASLSLALLFIRYGTQVVRIVRLLRESLIARDRQDAVEGDNVIKFPDPA
eukprot:GDKH01019689.1.p1 GENE.GDKH01019689.1~~GDKH01019689.1.p1  ORF type:complete len:189 (+),score=20.27 GDKH01019689.1:160-726(+)